MAYYFHPLLDALPVHLANVWVVDETYLLYEGKWGYLFTVLDGEHGSILAQVFSPLALLLVLSLSWRKQQGDSI